MLDSHRGILWRQVWGVAAVLAAILFSFTIYGIYQPKLLNQLGFVELAARLSIVQGFLGMGIEPLVGSLSDRILVRFGSRLPLITAGITLAGLIFVLIAFLIQRDASPTIQGLFPVLMTVWVMAMIAVRGPIAALLIQLAPLAELPVANAVVVLVLGLTAAVGPLLASLVRQLGASISFVSGAIILLIGGTVFYSAGPQQLTSFALTPAQPIPRAKFYLLVSIIFGAGLGTAFESNVLLGIMPLILQKALPQVDQAVIASSILLIAALSANPLSKWAVKWGEARAMQIGLGIILGLMGLSLFGLQNGILAILLIIALGIAFGLVFITTIPYALSIMPPCYAGLGTGLYFGGGGAATALFALIQQQTGGLMAGAGWAGAALAFLLASFCLTYSRYIP